jgi:hypothetical protein
MTAPAQQPNTCESYLPAKSSEIHELVLSETPIHIKVAIAERIRARGSIGEPIIMECPACGKPVIIGTGHHYSPSLEEHDAAIRAAAKAEGREEALKEMGEWGEIQYELTRELDTVLLKEKIESMRQVKR